MRRINLLPSDERGRAVERLGGGVLGILLIAGALVVVVMVGIYLVMLLRLNGLEDQVAQLDDDIAQQNARLAELSPYRDLKAQLDAKKPIADGIYSTRLAWDQFFQGLAFVVPDTTALDTLTAESSPVDIEATPEQPLEPAGTATFTGVALPRYENVADFVVRMDNFEYLANAELEQAALKTFSQKAVSFEVASALVTIAGQNGTEVKLEGVSQDELAASEGAR
ncbi:MAG TPA: PilN domain-containing protein [Rubrobacter sp.]|jgi:type IV pilus assembly protein PilN